MFIAATKVGSNCSDFGSSSGIVMLIIAFLSFPGGSIVALDDVALVIVCDVGDIVFSTMTLSISFVIK